MAQISGFFEAQCTGLTLHLLTIVYLYSIVAVGIKLWGYGTRLSGLSEGGSLRGARPDKLNYSSPFSILLGLSPLHWSCPGGILPPLRRRGVGWGSTRPLTARWEPTWRLCCWNRRCPGAGSRKEPPVHANRNEEGRGEPGKFSFQLILDNGAEEYAIRPPAEAAGALMDLFSMTETIYFDLGRKVLIFGNVSLGSE
jgi:hypothetical protein